VLTNKIHKDFFNFKHSTWSEDC